MTDVSFAVPRLPFPSPVVQQQQVQQQQAQANGGHSQQGGVHTTAPKHSIQSNETFIPRGTPAADLASLFPKVQLGA